MSEVSTLGAVKRILLGRPIPSRLAHHERLSKTTGLAVLSSDALSSVAYATEEILRTLVFAGVGALWLVTPIGAVISVLLLVVAFSYRQTIHAYPGGGGAYIVAKENIGVSAALVAGAALLTDYVLTVAVSVAAGVAAVTSAFPAWHEHRVALALAFVVLLTLGNLRGVRESGLIFALPTYFFLAAMLGLLAVGGVRCKKCDVDKPGTVVFEEADHFDESFMECPKCREKARQLDLPQSFDVRDLLRDFAGRRMPGKFLMCDLDGVQVVVELEAEHGRGDGRPVDGGSNPESGSHDPARSDGSGPHPGSGDQLVPSN